jgi:NAD(P)-dependent dehydrogenase (short-subunit alcohol dehydrogenase family)
MAWTTADIPDLSGRVAVVTGANGGLGLEVARELARKGAHVVMAARDQATDRAVILLATSEPPTPRIGSCSGDGGRPSNSKLARRPCGLRACLSYSKGWGK